MTQPPSISTDPLRGPGCARRLAGIPSPYLALHADDPVDWWPWGAAAVDEARRSARPLMVSVGFFACHWCHVLHKESLRDTEVAATINRHFVPVKVEREIHGALDAALQGFAQRQVGRRGWPVQVLVTPEGYPAAAGMYEPRDAFLEQMRTWAERWRAGPGCSFTAGAGTARPSPCLPALAPRPWSPTPTCLRRRPR